MKYVSLFNWCMAWKEARYMYRLDPSNENLSKIAKCEIQIDNLLTSIQAEIDFRKSQTEPLLTPKNYNYDK